MRIALAIGDAGGVGPELAARLLADPAMSGNDIVVVGDASVLKMGAGHAGVTLDLPVIPANRVSDGLPSGHVLVDLGNIPADRVSLGGSSPETGAASLQNFAAACRRRRCRSGRLAGPAAGPCGHCRCGDVHAFQQAFHAPCAPGLCR